MANEEWTCKTVQRWVSDMMHLRLRVNEGVPPPKIVDCVPTVAGPCGLTVRRDSDGEELWYSWSAIIDVQQIV